MLVVDTTLYGYEILCMYCSYNIIKVTQITVDTFVAFNVIAMQITTPVVQSSDLSHLVALPLKVSLNPKFDLLKIFALALYIHCFSVTVSHEKHMITNIST